MLSASFRGPMFYVQRSRLLRRGEEGLKGSQITLGEAMMLGFAIGVILMGWILALNTESGLKTAEQVERMIESQDYVDALRERRALEERRTLEERIEELKGEGEGDE